MIIRRARVTDTKFLYNCRNASSTRKMMLSKNFINYLNHKKWFKENLKSKTCYIYLGLKKKNKIGVVIFKTNKTFLNADVSITVHESFRGKFLSAELLKNSIRKFAKEYKYNINLLAVIKSENIKSIRIFKEAGFLKHSKRKNLIYLKRLAKYNKEKKIGLIIQARQTSKRLPNKVLKKIKGHSMIEILLARLIRSKTVNIIIVAIPKNKKNNKLNEHLNSIHANVFRGSEYNVLKRYYDVAKFYNFNSIARITSDCPLINYKILDKGVNFFEKFQPEYASNTNPRSTPKGFSVEIFDFKALKKSFLNAKKKYQKEHVNYYMLENKKFKKMNFYLKNSMFSKKNYSVDTLNDFKRVSKVFDKFYPNFQFDLEDVKKKITT